MQAKRAMSPTGKQGSNKGAPPHPGGIRTGYLQKGAHQAHKDWEGAPGIEIPMCKGPEMKTHGISWKVPRYSRRLRRRGLFRRVGGGVSPGHRDGQICCVLATDGTL